MKIIKESHIHPGISREWLESHPSAETFKISILDSPTRGVNYCTKMDPEIGEFCHYECRGDRNNPSRMTNSGTHQPTITNKVVVVEVPYNGDIVVATAYFGDEVADKEPFKNGWTAQDCKNWVKKNPNAFWATHALIYEPYLVNGEIRNYRNTTISISGYTSELLKAAEEMLESMLSDGATKLTEVRINTSRDIVGYQTYMYLTSEDDILVSLCTVGYDPFYREETQEGVVEDINLHWLVEALRKEVENGNK